MSININLEAGVRLQVAHLLSLVLADSYVLYTKTQNFHWNVVDPRFLSLHELFEKQYEELAEAIDVIAERIRMLGEKTPATLKQFLEMTTFKEPSKTLNANEMLQSLLEDHEALCASLRDQITLATDLNDQGSADLLIQRIRSHEKSAWMLRSHLAKS